MPLLEQKRLALRPGAAVLPRVDEMVPPARFADSRFSNYIPGHGSQEAALSLVAEFVRKAPAAERRGLFRRRQAAAMQPPGLYLDGAYGVGKTHLLAAAWHGTDLAPKVFVSFQQLVHHVGVTGLRQAREDFAGVRLLCLDEFELDDPGNTLIIKSFLESLFSQGARVITTSNTAATAQGEGRFNAEDFRREIQGIASSFRTVRLEGRDHRMRQPDFRAPAELVMPAQGPLVELDFSELLETLRSVHPASYGALLDGIGALLVTRVSTIATQNDALRFVHFIDRIYNDRRGLAMTFVPEVTADLRQLFHPSYRAGAYQKKHDRTVSRLLEMLTEHG